MCRRFGDGEWKSSGITAEPEITTQVLDGESVARHSANL